MGISCWKTKIKLGYNGTAIKPIISNWVCPNNNSFNGENDYNILTLGASLCLDKPKYGHNEQ